jgi:large subunit ribosomal protein L15
MSELNKLPKTTKRTKKRLGRGQGSGKGKTGGRGTKGQKARGDIKITFEGGQLPLIKRLPFLRGKNKNKPIKFSPLVINLKNLNILPQNSIVTVETLIKNKIVRKDDAEKFGVKILGDGKLEKPLTIKMPISLKARKKVESYGGKVEWTKSKS